MTEPSGIEPVKSKAINARLNQLNRRIRPAKKVGPEPLLLSLSEKMVLSFTGSSTTVVPIALAVGNAKAANKRIGKCHLNRIIRFRAFGTGTETIRVVGRQKVKSQLSANAGLRQPN